MSIGLVCDRLLVKALDRRAQVGAVGDGRGVAAFLVAADHPDDGAVACPRVEVRDPRAAAGAAGESAAVEPQLRCALPGGPVDASDRGVSARRVAGDAHQVLVTGVGAQLVGAEHVLDVLAIVRIKRDEADVKAGIGPAYPLRRDQHRPRQDSVSAVATTASSLNSGARPISKSSAFATAVKLTADLLFNRVISATTSLCSVR